MTTKLQKPPVLVVIQLNGGNGDDKMDGGGGHDFMDGGARNDRMNGGSGGDTLFGNLGFDFLDGGTGNDTLNGGDNNDTLKGGASGQDVFIFEGSWGEDVILDFEGQDQIDLSTVSEIGGFTDLVDNHIRDNRGEAEIFDDLGNSILLTGVAVSDIGTGLTFFEDNFIF